MVPMVHQLLWSAGSVPCMASMLPRTSCACSSASMLGMKLWFLIVSPYISPCKSPAAYAGVNLWSESAEAHGVPMNDVKFYNIHTNLSVESEIHSQTAKVKWLCSGEGRPIRSQTSGAYPHQAILWSNEVYISDHELATCCSSSFNCRKRYGLSLPAVEGKGVLKSSLCGRKCTPVWFPCSLPPAVLAA